MFTDIQQIFESIYSGRYSTPKKLNRSTHKLDSEYIEAIESGQITSEIINKIPLPIFVYKTCITIHGNLPDIERQRIGGYKNIIQNANGSLEIRYSAIDYNIKKQLGVLLQGIYSSQQTSATGIFFTKSDRTENKAEAIEILNKRREEAKKISVDGFRCKVVVSGYCYFGMFYIYTNIYPLLIEKDVLFIASHLTGRTIKELQDILQDKEEKERQYLIEINERSQKAAATAQQQQHEQQIKEAELSKQYRESILGVGTFITTQRNINGTVSYKVLQIEKAAFGRYKYKYQVMNEPRQPDNLQDGMKGKQVQLSDITKNKVFIL
jgi:DNA-binding transcriptional MerR regulator